MAFSFIAINFIPNKLLNIDEVNILKKQEKERMDQNKLLE